MASQITSVSIDCPTVCSGADLRKHQSHRWPVDSPQTGPVTWKMFPFDDVFMNCRYPSTINFIKNGNSPVCYATVWLDSGRFRPYASKLLHWFGVISGNVTIPQQLMTSPPQNKVRNRHMQIVSLKAESCLDANFLVFDGTRGCQHPVSPVTKKLASWQLSGYILYASWPMFSCAPPPPPTEIQCNLPFSPTTKHHICPTSCYPTGLALIICVSYNLNTYFLQTDVYGKEYFVKIPTQVILACLINAVNPKLRTERILFSL